MKIGNTGKALIAIAKWTVLIGILYKTVCMVEKTINSEIDAKEKYKAYYFFVAQWMHEKDLGHTIDGFLKQNKINKIAIYGAGAIGKLLYEELEKTSIQTVFFIDKNAEYIDTLFGNIKVYEMNRVSEAPKVDAIIITPFYYYGSIFNALRKIDGEVKILSIEKIVG